MAKKGLQGIKIETIGVIISTKENGAKNKVLIESYINNTIKYKNQDYIFTQDFPYWLLYRDDACDSVANSTNFDIVTAHRDRQIVKRSIKSKGRVRVLKSRNIGNKIIVNIPNYESFVDEYKNLSIAKYMNYRCSTFP